MNSSHNLSTNQNNDRSQKPRRMTHQKQAVYEVVSEGEGHLRAEDVYQAVLRSLPRISLATVYRNLHQMADEKLIGRVFIEGVWRFEATISDHYHAVCVACGVISNVDSIPASDIEEYFGRFSDFALTGHELILYGVCPACMRRRGGR